ncbi:MAG: hypothetical protein HYV27_10145 [Candidatus Hydrogenedentes bacterium]|nr:hypothetical protein [Candidatus Hydrogenedentota bacterium]
MRSRILLTVLVIITIGVCSPSRGEELTKEQALALWPIYLTTQSATVQWNGNVANGIPGRLSQATIDAILARLNMARAMAGLNPVTNDVSLNPKCQAAALVLSANPTWTISHTMPNTLKWWTKEAAEAAAKSCIDRNDEGPKAVQDFLRDWGMTSLNKYVGHRRWLLLPNLQTVGIGAVPQSSSYPSSVVIWVKTLTNEERRAVAWPPAGFVPMAFVPERWSWSAAGADMRGALVWVDGLAVTVSKQATSTPDSTIVWEPKLPFNVEDTTAVRIEGVLVNGVAQSINYEVKRFRP